jgi:hypothetical protein
MTARVRSDDLVTGLKNVLTDALFSRASRQHVEVPSRLPQSSAIAQTNAPLAHASGISHHLLILLQAATVDLMGCEAKTHISPGIGELLADNIEQLSRVCAAFDNDASITVEVWMWKDL